MSIYFFVAEFLYIHKFKSMKKNIGESETNKKILISLPPEVKEMAAARIRFFGNFSAYIAHLIDNDLHAHKSEKTSNKDGIQFTGSAKKSKIIQKLKK